MTESSNRCPQCGAVALADEADAFATCGFCGARLLLDVDPGIQHEFLVPALKADEMPSRLLSWLTEREALGTPGSVESRLHFFPFWVHTAGSAEELAPASALLSDGLASFRFPAGDAKAFGPELSRLGDVTPATVALDSVPFASEAPSTLRLVHLPFYGVSFVLFGKPIRVWVDAIAGQVLPFGPIPTSETRLDRVFAVLLFVLFAIAFTGFHWLYRGAASRGLLLLLVAGPLLMLATRQVIVWMEET